MNIGGRPGVQSALLIVRFPWDHKVRSSALGSFSLSGNARRTFGRLGR